MHDHRRRSTDQPATVSKYQEALDQAAPDLESGASTFPVFTEAPFSMWHQRHFRCELRRQIHPSATPVILPWDESEEELMQAINH